jgi:hypothetical protein
MITMPSSACTLIVSGSAAPHHWQGRSDWQPTTFPGLRDHVVATCRISLTPSPLLQRNVPNDIAPEVKKRLSSMCASTFQVWFVDRCWLAIAAILASACSCGRSIECHQIPVTFVTPLATTGEKGGFLQPKSCTNSSGCAQVLGFQAFPESSRKGTGRNCAALLEQISPQCSAKCMFYRGGGRGIRSPVIH